MCEKMTNKHYSNYDDIYKLLIEAHVEINTIEASLERGRHLQAQGAMQRAKDACYEGMQIAKKSIQEMKDE